ncbi:MAG: right-handed parallel beta-helix repeat-containing protein [Bacteroides sp.]|nr:right-handed parallel beta-helix repeat-containing protein [Bacteroides sp.]
MGKCFVFMLCLFPALMLGAAGQRGDYTGKCSCTALSQCPSSLKEEGSMDCTSSQARCYYVDAETGTVDGDGSVTHPFFALEAVTRLSFNPGDSILLAGGQTFSGTLHIRKFAGTAEHPLYISSFGKGKAVIDAGKGSALLVDSSRYVLIRNIEVRGDGRLKGNDGSGIDIKYSTDIQVDSVEASGFLWNGVGTFGGADIRLTRIYAHDNGFNGIEVSGPWSHKEVHRVYVGYCVAENNPGNPKIKDNHSGSGILIAHSTGVQVEYCEAMNNGWDMPRIGNGPVGIWAFECDSLTIQYCFSHDNKTAPGARDGGGFDFDGGVTNSVMRYNLSMNNEGAGYGLFQFGGASDWTNNFIHHNVSINDGRKNSQAGFFIWCDPYNKSVPLRNSYICSNIVLSCYGHAVSFETGYARNLLFEKNVFVLTGSAGRHTGGNKVNSYLGGDRTKRNKEVTFNRNVYWSSVAEKEGIPQRAIKRDQTASIEKRVFDIPVQVEVVQIKELMDSFFHP